MDLTDDMMLELFSDGEAGDADGDGAAFGKNAENSDGAEKEKSEKSESTRDDGENTVSEAADCKPENAENAAKIADDCKPDAAETDGGESAKEDAAEGSHGDAEKEILERIWKAKAAMGIADVYASLCREAEKVKEVYPSFDLERECRDKRFTAMIACGIDVRCAYEALHHAEILASAMQYAASAVYEASAKSLRETMDRPLENGVFAGAAIDPKKDVASLTDSDILAIIKRVENGERIKF